MTERDIPIFDRETLAKRLRSSQAWRDYGNNGILTVSQIVDIVITLHRECGYKDHSIKYK